MVQKTDNISSQFPNIEGTVAQCSLPNAISFKLNLASTALRIRVALPLNELIKATSNNPAANIHRYPVLYLLDANASFASVVETNRRLSRRPDATRVAPAIIVGIDGDSGTLYDTELRKQLYSDVADAAPSSESQPAPLAEINAEKFLGFIKTELIPLIQRLFPADPQQQYLLGHSLAGYFTTWLLANHPATFQGYAAISPSLWQNPDTLNALSSGTWQQQNATEENAEPTPFIIHVGSHGSTLDNYQEIIMPLSNFTVRDSETSAFGIKADISNIFDGNNNYYFETNNEVTIDPVNAPIISDNMKTVFTIN